MYTIDFTGKVVLVIGAGTGIGAAIARGFNDAGANLAITYNGSAAGAEAVADEVRAAGHRCFARRVDTRSVPEIETAIDEAIEAMGAIDVLVYNAGLTEPRPLFDLTEEEWDRTLDINLKGMFFCARHTAAHMRDRQRRGSIVLISSVHSIQAYPGHPHYASSKAGINMLTKSLAVELTPLGIRVNALAPGSIDITPHRNQEVVAPRDLRPYIPIGRQGRPSEIADVAVFLASERASYVTGSVLFADGGLTLPMHLPR
jgi:glucose 1-dehydrogenase